MVEQNKQPDWNRVEGVIGKEARESLGEKRVVIIGVGSLGSEITRLLSMTGVGKFTLIDPDKLEASNIVRHAAGLSELGKFKVESIRNLIQKEKNPKADIWAVAGDARFQYELISHGDLAIIAGLGSNSRQAHIAEELRKRNVLTIAAGVYQMGEGGEVFIVKPNEGPCYSCFSTFLSREIADEARESIQEYGASPDQVRAMPALAIDINRIATIAAGLAVKTLLRQDISEEDSKKNLLIFANKKLLIGLDPKTRKDVVLDQLHSKWLWVGKNKNCLICNSLLKGLPEVSFQEVLSNPSLLDNLQLDDTLSDRDIGRGGEQDE